MAVGNTYISVQNLLKAVAALQQESGQPIAQKIIFDACSVFKELKPEQVASFRALSMKLNTEIVGNTDFALSSLENNRISFKNGQVGYFTASDKSEKEGWEAHLLPIIQTAYALYDRSRFGPNNVWIDCHMGNTQKAGETCQKIKEPIEEIAGYTPLGLLAQATAPLVKSAFHEYGSTNKEAIAKVQKLLLNDSEREQLRLRALHQKTQTSEPSSEFLLPMNPLEMSRRADAILKNSGLLKKDHYAAEYLRDPELREGYIDAMKSALRKEKDPTTREAASKMILAAEDFVKIDRLVKALANDERKKLEAEHLQEMLPQPALLRYMLKSQRKPEGRE